MTEVPITKEAVIKYVLMGDYYIDLPFVLARPIPFRRGCYLLYEEQKFEIMSNVQPEFDSKTGGYKYTIRFEAQQAHMKRRKVFWLKSRKREATFHDTTDLASFGNLIADNMNEFMAGGRWKVAAVPPDLTEQAKLVSFNGDSCWNAITTIAETFECEWWTVDNGAEVWIYFGKLEFGTPEVFKRGDVVSSIPVKKGDNTNYGTRFFVFGSTRNLPDDYNQTTQQSENTNHVSEVRLQLPGGMEYIDAWENIAQEDIVEQVVFFEDIFPKNTETVTSISTVKRKVENSDNDQATFDAYVMYCQDTPFVPSHMLVGVELGCRFTSGALNGWEFALDVRDRNDKKYDPETWKPEDGFLKKFEIIAQTEQIGENEVLTIPNASLHPAPGDTFVLTGVTLPPERIAEAENELLKVGKAWAIKNSSDTDVYECPTNPVYCTRNEKNYDLGQKVLLDDERFGIGGRASRIQGFEKKLWNPYIATYTVGDNTAYSRLGEIEKNIVESAYAERIGVTSGVGIYLIRSKFDDTAPTDYNAYSALATEAKFLSKLKGGRVLKDVTFDKDVMIGGSVHSSDFASGPLGAGWRVDREGNGEMESLILRRFLEAPEFRKNKISVIGDEFWVSAAGLIESVREANSLPVYVKGRRALGKDGKPWRIKTGPGYIVRFKLEEGDSHAFKKDDILVSKFEQEGGFQSAWFRVLYVLSGREVFVTALNDYAPQVAMSVARQGNFTDPTRQNSIYISGKEGYIRVLSGVNSTEIKFENIRCQYGNLEGLTVDGIGALHGYGEYSDNAYKRGVFLMQGGKRVEDFVLESIETLQNSLGGLAFEDKVEKALLGNTIISGGYIRSELIAVDDALVSRLVASDAFIAKLTASEAFVDRLVARAVSTQQGSNPQRVELNRGTGAISIVNSDNEVTLNINSGEKLNNGWTNGGIYLQQRMYDNELHSSHHGADKVTFRRAGYNISTEVNFNGMEVSRTVDGAGQISHYYVNGIVLPRGARLDMPGVIAAGRINSKGTISNQWGCKNCTSYKYSNQTGKYRIYHNLGHTNYFVQATPSVADNTWAKVHAIILDKLADSCAIAIYDSGTSNDGVDIDFEFLIVGDK